MWIECTYSHWTGQNRIQFVNMKTFGCFNAMPLSMGQLRAFFCIFYFRSFSLVSNCYWSAQLFLDEHSLPCQELISYMETCHMWWLSRSWSLCRLTLFNSSVRLFGQSFPLLRLSLPIWSLISFKSYTGNFNEKRSRDCTQKQVRFNYKTFL